MIKFQVEKICDCQKEIMANVPYHNKDTKSYTRSSVAIDWNTYILLDDSGSACLVTARKEKELVGYMVFLVSRHLNHDILLGVATTTYVKPGHRKQGIVRDMLVMSEVFLKRRKVHTMVVSVTTTADYSGALKRTGFRFMETNYYKEL